MKRNVFFSTALLLVISLIAVSCAPANLQNDDTVQVYFGYLEAKAVDTTAYDVTGSTADYNASVEIGAVNDYYWTYTAVKSDQLFKTGEKTAQTKCADTTGLGGTRTFSKGKWKFTLYAYASSTDRDAGIAGTAEQYIFTGSADYDSDTDTNNGVVSIPVSYSYKAGTGTAHFSISTSLTQDTSFATQYSITGVTALVNGTEVALTKNATSGKWEKDYSVASGVKTIGLKVYVDTASVTQTSDDNLISQASKDNLGTAIVLHGLTTNITGSATVTLTGSTMEIKFSSDLSGTEGQNPGQPTEDGFNTDDDSGTTIDYSKYSVGSTGPAGGLIFYDAGSVQTSYYMDGSTKKSYTWRFLEAAPADASTSTVIFGYYRTTSTGDNLTVQSDLDTTITKDDHTTYNGNAAVGQGRMNTSLLVNAMGQTAYSSSSDTTPTATYAAKLCDDYTYGEYTDWFLPSIEELRYMYENLKAKSNGTWSNYYWSSSESSASSAWDCYFNSGLARNSGRFNDSYVRAVRAF